MTPAVRICPDSEALGRAAAAWVADRIAARLREAATFALVLSGGGTPLPLYHGLAADYGDRLPWAQVHVYWGDERSVPHDAPQSNYRMAREALLDRVPVPPANIHPMHTHPPDPNATAAAYEATLRAAFPGPWPRFDLILLGLGADGHTASLFPGSSALDEHERWVVAVSVPADPPVRLTLTLPVLRAAAHVGFLVVGANKAEALRRALGTPDPRTCPAAAVRPEGGVTWWVDAAAASRLESGRSSAGRSERGHCGE